MSTSAVVVGALFLLKFSEILFRFSLADHGIVPRTVPGLVGILWSPLLHANLGHLLSNAVPLFVFLVLLLRNPRYRPVSTLAFIWIASGLGTWLIGRGDSVHIGASSVIFGLAAFLIAAGFYLREWSSILVGAIVVLFFGGMFQGVIPSAGPISWEGHLCGAVAGILAASHLRR